MVMINKSFASMSGGAPDLNVQELIFETLGAFLERSFPHLGYVDVAPTDLEEYKAIQVGGLGAMPQVAEGAALPLDALTQQFTKTQAVVDYGVIVKLGKKFQRSNPYGLVEQLPAALARSAGDTLSTACANILNRAFSNSYTYGDGKELCATDHPGAGGASIANELASAADLSVSSLDQATADMMTMTDYRGKIAGVRADTLVVAPLFRRTALELVGSPVVPTGNNDVKNVYEGSMGVVVDPWLTDSDAWFLVDKANSPIKLRMRQEFQVVPGYEDVTQSVLLAASMAFALTAASFYGIFGSPGA